MQSAVFEHARTTTPMSRATPAARSRVSAKPTARIPLEETRRHNLRLYKMSDLSIRSANATNASHLLMVSLMTTTETTATINDSCSGGGGKSKTAAAAFRA